ncbi:type 1 glutamine amidotransferase domain-containing protein [Arthrobacter sp. Sa2CUA1]|uniref:Type 1 glutamine amidotransferase domain-containing protein n=1 Tax=Arthrobacter gallicola TaxID=2762225 RepID=A0ABR8UWA5_9MICC|nr:type 1 glutamine amidotransferase domain-containing protein [Arthrobacter gallicola]MBD7996829.1 type 1 glutamine amidotransferase domain-containing protein [Arthrobacter gallicola]
MNNILMIVSAANSLTMKDGSEHPTGFWAEELVEAHRTLLEAGHRITFATPGAKAPTVDEISLTPEQAGGEEKAERLRAYLEELRPELDSPMSLADVVPLEYDAVVIPGGHGPMADLTTDWDMGRILIAANDAGLVIAPFCHGPAALLSAETPDAGFAFSARRLTVFTNSEELGGGTGENTPWFVADALRDKGAIVEAGPDWESFVVTDGNLITGQNPQSSVDVARQVAASLQG